MSTTTKKVGRLAGSACVLAVILGCAVSQPREAPRPAYNGGPLGFGTTPSAAELAQFFSYPADGRGLPPGSGTWAQGKKVYETKCLACHGEKLQGTPIGDRLIGGRGTLTGGSPSKPPIKTVESYWPYATTLFDYVKRAMPFNAPGSLTDDEVYAVSAYILGEANIIAQNEVLNAQTLPAVRMPNRDGFITRDPRPDVK